MISICFVCVRKDDSGACMKGTSPSHNQCKYFQGHIIGLESLSKYGTNSTAFTMCCGTAICDDQTECPSCKKLVIGFNAESNHERHLIRWRHMTANWK